MGWSAATVWQSSWISISNAIGEGRLAVYRTTLIRRAVRPSGSENAFAEYDGDEPIARRKAADLPHACASASGQGEGQ